MVYKGAERDKSGKLRDREKERKRIIMALIINCLKECTHIHLSLTTRQCRGVCVCVPNCGHLCVCKRVCWLPNWHSITERRWQFHVVWQFRALSKCLLGNTHSLFLSHSQTQTQTEHLPISTEWLWLHHWWETALSANRYPASLISLQMPTQQN